MHGCPGTPNPQKLLNQNSQVWIQESVFLENSLGDFDLQMSMRITALLQATHFTDQAQRP